MSQYCDSFCFFPRQNGVLHCSILSKRNTSNSSSCRWFFSTCCPWWSNITTSREKSILLWTTWTMFSQASLPSRLSSGSPQCDWNTSNTGWTFSISSLLSFLSQVSSYFNTLFFRHIIIILRLVSGTLFPVVWGGERERSIACFTFYAFPHLPVLFIYAFLSQGKYMLTEWLLSE